MKNKVRLLFIAVVSVLFFASCSRNNPKDVAHDWLVGFNHMDFDDAMKLSTNDTKNLLYSLEQLTGVVSDSERNELKKITVTIKNVKEDSTTAVVTYFSSDNTNVQSLNLVKQDNKWLVLFTKSDLVGVIPEDAKEEGTPFEESTEPDTLNSEGGSE